MLGEKGVQNRMKVELVQLGKYLKIGGLDPHPRANPLRGFTVAHHISSQNMVKLQLLGSKVLAQHTRLLVPLSGKLIVVVAAK